MAPAKRGAFRKVDAPATARSALALSGNTRSVIDTAEEQVPLPLALQFAATVQRGFLASTHFAAGLMGGAAALEVSMLSVARNEPLSPFALYADSALHFWRLYLWGGLSCCVGTGLLLLRRRRSRYYDVYPTGRWVNLLTIASNASVVAIGVALRGPVWRLAAPESREQLPYLVPTSSAAYHAAVTNPGPFGHAVPAAVLLRALLCWLALLLSYGPHGDEQAALPPSAEEEAGGGRGHQPHLLASGATEGADGVIAIMYRGVVFAAAFGAVARRPHSTPDGKPAPMRPVPPGAISHEGYASRVSVAIVFMAVDSINTLLCLSLLYESLELRRSSERFERVLPELISLVVLVVARSVIAAQLFGIIVRTAAFRLGLLTQLTKHFRRPFGVQLAAFVLSLILLIVRVVDAADDDATIDATNIGLLPSGSSLGAAYTVLLCLSLALTVLCYTSTLDALRRLSRSEYYLHPDRGLHP